MGDKIPAKIKPALDAGLNMAIPYTFTKLLLQKRDQQSSVIQTLLIQILLHLLRGKNQRSNDNWRVARAVVARDKRAERISSKNDALAKNNAQL